jgi:hypothetical protein
MITVAAEKTRYKILDFSYFPRRLVNIVTEALRRARGWSYEDLAFRMENEMTAEKMKRHYIMDGCNSGIIARLCEVHGLPTLPSKDFFTGEINRTLKHHLKLREWSYRELVRKIYPGIENQELESEIANIQKFYENCSTDAWRIARQCEIFKLPTLPSWWFLSEQDLSGEKGKKFKMAFL